MVVAQSMRGYEGGRYISRHSAGLSDKYAS